MVSSAMRPLLGSPILKVLRGAGFGSLVTASRPAGSQRAAHAGDDKAASPHTCMHVLASSHQAAAGVCTGSMVQLLCAAGTVLWRWCGALTRDHGSITRCQQRCLLGYTASAASPLQHGHDLDGTIKTQTTHTVSSAHD